MITSSIFCTSCRVSMLGKASTSSMTTISGAQSSRTNVSESYNPKSSSDGQRKVIFQTRSCLTRNWIWSTKARERVDFPCSKGLRMKTMIWLLMIKIFRNL